MNLSAAFGDWECLGTPEACASFWVCRQHHSERSREPSASTKRAYPKREPESRPFARSVEIGQKKGQSCVRARSSLLVPAIARSIHREACNRYRSEGLGSPSREGRTGRNASPVRVILERSGLHRCRPRPRICRERPENEETMKRPNLRNECGESRGEYLVLGTALLIPLVIAVLAFFSMG